jgi:hypothetical protein
MSRARDRRDAYTPACALTSAGSRQLDEVYKRAESIRNAVPTGVIVKTCEIVPIKGKYVSGLHVPSNLTTLVGNVAYNRHKRIQGRALKALEARND